MQAESRMQRMKLDSLQEIPAFILIRNRSRTLLPHPASWFVQTCGHTYAPDGQTVPYTSQLITIRATCLVDQPGKIRANTEDWKKAKQVVTKDKIRWTGNTFMPYKASGLDGI